MAKGVATGAVALALLVLPTLDAAAQGVRGRSVSRGGGGAKTRTVVVVSSLDDGRQYSRIVDRQRAALDRMDGTLRSRDTEARVAAFLEAGELRLIDERVQFGKDGDTARNRYYANDGKLVYFESVRVRPRKVGEDRLPARDEVVTTAAFGEDGRLVGAAQTINREAVPLASADEAGIRSRFAALARAVAAAPH